MANKHFKITDAEAGELVMQRVDVRGESPERMPFDRMMLRNRAFFFGKQHFVEDAKTGRLRDPVNLPPHRVLYKANLLKGDVLRSILTVTGARGEFVVPPKGNTRKARHGAWVSTKLFEHISRTLLMEQKEQLAAIFAAIDGSVFWKPHWDPDKGESDRYYWADTVGKKVLGYDPDPLLKERLEEDGKYDDLPLGEVAVDLFPALQVDWDWRAREGGVDECDWIATKQVVDMAYIKERWPDKVHLVKPDETLEGSLYYNEAISFMASNYAPLATYRPRSQMHGQQAILVEYFERPKRAANGNLGRQILWAGDAVLENRDNSYRRTKHPLPFVKQDWVAAVGRFLGLSLVEDLVGPQSQYNKGRAKIIEHGNVFGAPAIFVPENSSIPTGAYSVQPGCVYEYKPTAGKIEHGPTPTLPKEVIESVAQSRQEMGEISSQQSLDGSKLPGQLRSGPALETIFEERNKGLVHPATQFLIAKARVGQQLLEIAHLRYSPERVIQYVGDDKKFRVLSFSMSEVSTDLLVIVDRGKILSSPAATRARIMEMVQIGVVDPVNNPEDREAVFKALEFGGVDELISDRLQEEENQEREIAEMLADPIGWITPRVDRGAPIPPQGESAKVVRGYPTNPWDDDVAHERVLKRFIRSEEFRELDPAVEQPLIFLHWQEHKAKIEQAMMQQAILQQALQGSPGQKGKPSAPKAPAMSQ